MNSHTVVDYSLLAAVFIYMLKFGIEWLREKRSRDAVHLQPPSNGNGKPTLYDIRAAMTEEREHAVSQITDNFGKGILLLRDDLKDLQRISGEQKEALIEFLAYERGRRDN